MQCYACHKQIQRNINNDSFKPRWRKLESKESKRCGIADCKAIASKVTQMATTEEIEYTLEQKVVSFTIDGMGVHVPLCQTHYNNLYTQINTVSTCASCGGRSKRGDRFNRHCPNPGIVNSVLTTVTNETSGLTKESIICTACYKYFKVMIKNVQISLMDLSLAIRRLHGLGHTYLCLSTREKYLDAILNYNILLLQ